MMVSIAVLGRDEIGVVAEFSGEGINGPYRFRYYLTPCCGADATGTFFGVACRACYEQIAADLGGAPPAGALPETYGDGISYEQWKSGAKLSNV